MYVTAPLCAVPTPSSGTVIWSEPCARYPTGLVQPMMVSQPGVEVRGSVVLYPLASPVSWLPQL